MRLMQILLLLLSIVLPILTQDSHMYTRDKSRNPTLEYKLRFRDLEQKDIDSGETEPYNERLPLGLSPLSYFVRLQPFVNGDKSVTGYVEIVFDALQSISNITLHMVDIIYDEASFLLQTIDGITTIDFISHSYDPATDFYVGTLAEPLEAGTQYILSFDYNGIISETLDGFYQSSYINEEGEEVQLAVTHFQPTHSREIIPCLDEPSFKATYQMEIGRENSQVTLSNTEILSNRTMEGFPGWIWELFDITPIMSIYLVAFVVSDFVSISTTSSTGIIFNTWARSERIEYGQYSLQVSPVISSFFEGYFDIFYPMPKQDQIAIPDSGAGATENWGLITYRELLLLWDPILGTTSAKQLVAQIISHELVHTWTGNLVTAAWWDNLWLNEGFASYYEYVGTESAEPDMDMLLVFIYETLQSVFISDASEFSNPMVYDVLTPGEISSMYNTNTYSKGGSLVRMMEYFLTHDTFLQGMKNYLNANSYGNADQDNLFQHLNDQAHLDGVLDPSMSVKAIMDTWTLQPGYPLITVTDNNDGTLLITQERYLTTPNPDAIEYTYWVPISFASNAINADFSDTAPSAWMSLDDNELLITTSPSPWYIFNIHQAMYYRVNYDTDIWNGIAAHLLADYASVDIRNRAQLLDDSYILAETGRISYETHFSIGEYIANEDHYVPWKTILFNMNYIEEMLSRTPGYSGLRDYLRQGLDPTYDIVGSVDNPSDPDRTVILRDAIVPWACDMLYEPCIESASSQYALWMTTPEDYSIISPNLKSSIYCTAIKAGSDVEWDFALSHYQTTEREEEAEFLLFGMACSSDQATLLAYLEMSFTVGSPIADEGDSTSAFADIASTDLGRDLAWDYLVTNYHDIATFFGGSYITVQSLASDASREFNTEKDLFELEAFADLIRAETNATVTIDSAINRVEDNIEWMTTNYDTIANWLFDNGYGLA